MMIREQTGPGNRQPTNSPSARLEELVESANITVVIPLALNSDEVATVFDVLTS